MFQLPQGAPRLYNRCWPQQQAIRVRIHKHLEQCIEAGSQPICEQHAAYYLSYTISPEQSKRMDEVVITGLDTSHGLWVVMTTL